MNCRTVFGAAVCALMCAASGRQVAAAHLLPHTLQAWERYLPWADQKNDREFRDPQRFLIEDDLPQGQRAAIQKQIRMGRVVVERRTGVVPTGESFSVPDGTIHHWWGAVLVPDITLERLLRLMQDYDGHAGRFVEVERSRLIARDGNTFRFSMRLRRTKAPITVYYNSEGEAKYVSRGPGRASMRSEATKIAELEYPGTSRERELSHDEDWGFLWRAVAWWRLVEVENGVIVECESASLGRGIPGWLKYIPGMTGYIESVPRESIVNTLTGLRTSAASFR
jgi:hypothetical protein